MIDHRRAQRGAVALVATMALAMTLAACGSPAGGSGSSKEVDTSKWEKTAYPTPDEATMKEMAAHLMNPSVDVNALAPEIQTALTVASRDLTDKQRQVLDECLQKASCETGTGGYTLAIIDDQVNTFYSVTRAEAVSYAIKTGAIKKIIHFASNFDVPKYLSDFRSAIGQKVDLIISNYGGVGNQVGPVLEQAKAAGIPVVNGVAQLSDEVTKKLNVHLDVPLCDMWANNAEQLAAELKSRGKPLTYALFTGPAGNAYAAYWQPCASKALDGAGLKKVYSGNTEWTPQGTVKAAAALRASGAAPGVLAYDTYPENFMQAYMDAGDKNMPMFALTGASDIGTAKAYKNAVDAGFEPAVFASTNNSWLIDIELASVLWLKDGKKASSDTITWLPSFTELADVVPNTDLNQDNFAFLGSPLAPEDQAEALKH
jgi:ABC-type sugar transport system substrate-binding protein